MLITKRHFKRKKENTDQTEDSLIEHCQSMKKSNMYKDKTNLFLFICVNIKKGGCSVFLLNIYAYLIFYLLPCHILEVRMREEKSLISLICLGRCTNLLYYTLMHALQSRQRQKQMKSMFTYNALCVELQHMLLAWFMAYCQ